MLAQVYNIPSLYNLLVNSDSPDIRNARLHLEVHTEREEVTSFRKEHSSWREDKKNHIKCDW